MNAAKNAWFLQIDHRVEKILKKEGVIVLSSPDAWEKYRWARRYFLEKPKEGFFIWVTKQVPFPISTCVTISGKGVEQRLSNLVVVESGISVKSYSLCNTASMNLSGVHVARGKVILKEGASMELLSVQSWGKNDKVDVSYTYVLKKNTSLFYRFKNFSPPKVLKTKNVFKVWENAKVRAETSLKVKSSLAKVYDYTFLYGKHSDAISKLRVVASNGAKVYGYTKMVANNVSKGHLDCQGLMIDNTSKIAFVPALINANKDATLTHEASIGRISEDALNYLMTRGLSEDNAIELIVSGFLK